MSPRAIALAAAVAAGVAGWLAHPPSDLWLLAFTVPALLATAVTASDLPPWRLGAVTGLVTNLAMLHWLRFRATVVAWLLLAVIMAAWMALLAVLLHRLVQRRWTIALVPLVWVGIDAWSNAWPFGGFGWATLGVSQVDNGWLTPLGRVLGEKGFTLVVVTLSLAAWLAIRDALAARRGEFSPVVTGSTATETATSPGLWQRRAPRREDGDTDATTTRSTSGAETQEARGVLLLSTAGRDAAQRMGDGAWVGTAALVVTMLAVTLVTIAPPPTVGTADVVAIQPNDVEVPDDTYTAITRRLAGQAVDLTRAEVDANGPADIVVWPEGTIGRDPARDPQLAGAIVDGAAATGGGLVVGTDLEDPDSDGYRRVSIVVDEAGAVTDTYVKQRLVPFGEFVPMRWAFDWYPALAQVSRDAIPGTAADNVVVTTPDGRDLRVAVAICFETMFPDAIRANILAEGPAQFLVSSTSDASFGRTGQPDQHLDQVRMRAIETGRWAVHAAVSGTTAVVDQSGRVVAGDTDLFTLDTVRADVGLVDGPTPFLRIGDVLDPVTRALVVVVALALAIATRRRRPDPSGSGGPESVATSNALADTPWAEAPGADTPGADAPRPDPPTPDASSDVRADSSGTQQ